MAKVLFLPGSGTDPLASPKCERLRDEGHQVETCTDLAVPDDLAALGQAPWAEHNRRWFDQAVQAAQEVHDRFKPHVIVGAGLGGAVAMNLHSGTAPQVLVGPAWRVWLFRLGDAVSVRPATVVVHGDRDWLVAPRFSRQLLEASPPAGSREQALVARIQQRLCERLVYSAEDLRIEGRLVRVVDAGHQCDSEPALQALVGAVEVLAGLG
jgi:hypothetical protein